MKGDERGVREVGMEGGREYEGERERDGDREVGRTKTS